MALKNLLSTVEIETKSPHKYSLITSAHIWCLFEFADSFITGLFIKDVIWDWILFFGIAALDWNNSMWCFWRCWFKLVVPPVYLHSWWHLVHCLFFHHLISYFIESKVVPSLACSTWVFDNNSSFHASKWRTQPKMKLWQWACSNLYVWHATKFTPFGHKFVTWAADKW